MGTTGTPAAEAVEKIVVDLFGEGIIGIGQYNRRYISGTTVWSQHSWANGIDIHVSRGTATGEAKIVGDAIAKFLRDNKYKFGIRTILWWRKAHYDHLHVDMWPKGTGTPPTTLDGVGRFEYRDGRIVYEKIREVAPLGDFDGYEIPEIPDLEEDDMAFEQFVTDLQEDLNDAGFTDYEDKELTVDGVYGPRTRSAHFKMIMAAAENPQPGPAGPPGPAGQDGKPVTLVITGDAVI